MTPENLKKNIKNMIISPANEPMAPAKGILQEP